MNYALLIACWIVWGLMVFPQAEVWDEIKSRRRRRENLNRLEVAPWKR